MANLVEVFKDVLRALGLGGFENAVGPVVSFIMFLGSVVGIITGIVKTGSYLVKIIRNRPIIKDLHPYFTSSDIKEATCNFIPTKYLENAPSDSPEPGSISLENAKKLLPLFLKEIFRDKNDYANQRLFLVLADSGMGKTTFLLNLYMKYALKRFGKKYDIRMLPLGDPVVDEELDGIEIERKKNTILLLDGFDEDTQAINDFKKRMKDIEKKTHLFQKVIITCRTQFYPSKTDEPSETSNKKFGEGGGYEKFQKFYIALFDDKDVSRYLRKKYSIFNFKKKRRAFEVIKKSPDLMARPMLLSYIDDLITDFRQYEYASEIYEELVKKWIERESKRYKKAERENFKNNMFTFSIDVAVDIYRNNEIQKELVIKPDKLEFIARRNGIPLENVELKSRSLLNRDTGGDYKFAHKSVLEYILALVACNNIDFDEELRFEGMDQAQRFYTEIFKNKAFELLKKSDGKFRTNTSQELTKLIDLEKKEINNIRELYLNDNEIDDTRALKVLMGVEILDLGKNRISQTSPLRELKALKQLWLNHNQVFDISPLKELSNLETLDLENNRISDTVPLKAFTGLKKLNLRNNRINGMFFLNFNIKDVLDLSDNEITQIWISIPLNGLDELYLNNNQIDKIEVFSNKYNCLKNLKLLDVSGNPSLPIYQVLGLKDILPSNCTVKSDIHDDFFRLVKVGGTFKTDSENEISLRALKLENIDNVTSLSLSRGPTLINLIAKWKIFRKNLKHLTVNFDKTISEPPKYTADLGLVYTDEELLSRRISDISNLKELVNLVELNLYNVVPKDIRALKELKNLKRLHLDWGEIIKDISVLGELKELEHLSLCSNAIIDISVLKTLKQLHTLDVSSNKIEDIKPLRHLEKLRHLDLSYNPISNTYVLCELKNLENLDIKGVQVNDIRILEELEENGVEIKK